MLVEVEVQSLGMDRTTRSPVVVLREREGGRVLPIWIGAVEASAIAMHLAGATFPRPLTHDLLVHVLDATATSLVRVEIPRMVGGTYHAALILQRGSDTVRVDARPSDSIAIAIRAGADIFAADELLRLVALEVDDSEELPADGEAGAAGGEGPTAERSPGPGGGPRPMSPEELADYLRKLDPEDFGRFTP